MILKNKKALIIGIASKRSIAASIAKLFSQNGAEIALTYQNDKLKSRVEEIGADLNSTSDILFGFQFGLLSLSIIRALTPS